MDQADVISFESKVKLELFKLLELTESLPPAQRLAVMQQSLRVLSAGMTFSVDRSFKAASEAMESALLSLYENRSQEPL